MPLKEKPEISLKDEADHRRTVPLLLGRSSDGRTNRWGVTCPACQRNFEPQTTMFKTQSLECRNARCCARMVAHYNDDFVEIAR